MALINLKNIKVGFGSPLLLDGVDLQIEKGERVCLVGRNGAGKSTFMKVISGALEPDGGEVTLLPGLKVSMLQQDVPTDLTGTVFDVITSGIGDVNALMNRYHSALKALEEGVDAMAELEAAHHELERTGCWQATQRVEEIISRLSLPANANFQELSGGYKRRALLGRALAASPDLLLLDEPTNHLDIASIGWLEDFLLGYNGTLLFVTHDRMLQQRLATRIIELDRGSLHNWQCDYRTYVERKDALLENEAKMNALFDKKLSEEEAWLRQGVKARRTRNEGRVRALLDMRKERSERRALEGSANLRAMEADISGRLVIEAKKVSFSYGEDSVGPAIIDFSTVIMRGDKVGVIGPNGSGKTTLLKLLLGKLKPTSGSVRLGSRLEVAYFDQLRAALDPERTVQENVAEGRDQVMIDGRARHVIGYLQDFLFTPSRARTPVKALSGGERNRLLLAKLFSQPSNLLVMDEPTNDLDIDTLDLLEELLSSYSGTVLLVSHDRAFLNNVATSTIVFEEGGLNEYIGGYDDWLRQRPSAKKEARAEAAPKQERQKKEKAAKLSFKEEKELKELPARIEALEAEQHEITAAMSDPEVYKQGGQKAAELKARIDEVDRLLKGFYERWEELEARNA